VSVSSEEVLRIAQLAELHVDEESLPELVAQMSRILDYVAQLRAVGPAEHVKPFIPGPDTIRFRPDEVNPWPLAFGPDKMAPAFKGGFFLVPRLGAFGDEGEAGEEA